ncbi:hypothetical protein DFQ27_003633 [Actinomortierella ambigua]|uniref:Histidine kinase n=1 Tax=Actinomortierella ambigua TaxID=1343610 RepID=A0A9P6U5P4_9FUNG|nr:hypothetical protein DFQ27_003633 [Actinomortierella ambigua]
MSSLVLEENKGNINNIDNIDNINNSNNTNSSSSSNNNNTNNKSTAPTNDDDNNNGGIGNNNDTTDIHRGSAVLLNGHTPPSNGHPLLDKTMTTTDDSTYFTHPPALESSGGHNTTSGSSNDGKGPHRVYFRRQRRRMATLQRWIEIFPDPFILCDPSSGILASNQMAKDTFGGILHLKRTQASPSFSTSLAPHRNGVDNIQLNDLFDLLAPASSKHSLHSNGGAHLAQRSTSRALGIRLTEPTEATSSYQQQQQQQPQQQQQQQPPPQPQQQQDPLNDRYPSSLAQIQKELPAKRIVRRKTCHGDQRLFLESLAPVYGCSCCKGRCECPDSDEGAMESEEDEQESRAGDGIHANGDTTSQSRPQPEPWLRKHYTTTRKTGLEPVVGFSVVLTDLSRVLPESMASSWSILEHASLPTPPGASDGGDQPSLDLEQPTANAQISTQPSTASTSRAGLRLPTPRQHHHPPRVAPDKQATDTHSRGITTISEEASEGRVAVAASCTSSLARISTPAATTTVVDRTTIPPTHGTAAAAAAAATIASKALHHNNSNVRSTIEGFSSLRSLPPLLPSSNVLPSRDPFLSPPTPRLSASSRFSTLHLPPATSILVSTSSSPLSSTPSFPSSSLLTTSNTSSSSSTSTAPTLASASSSSQPSSRPRSYSAVPPLASHALPSFLSASHRSSSSTSSSSVSPPHSPLQSASGAKGSTWMPSYMSPADAAATLPAPPKTNNSVNNNSNNNNSSNGSKHTHSQSLSHHPHHYHHHHSYFHHHHIPWVGGEGEDPYFSFLAPIASQLLLLQGDALFDQVVQIVATQLRVKYCFVSQLLTLDELKEHEPGEYAALVEQFGGQVPPIDGVMHNLSSWSGEAHVNPHAFQGYLVDMTIQEQWTSVNRDLALIHPDVAESLMDKSIKSHVGVRLESEHGDIMGVLGIIHDSEMTDEDVNMVRSVLERVGVRVANELDRFRIEANLVYQREVAESTAKNKTKFLADMSHEIRNPMNAVVGVTEILLDTEGLTDEQSGLVDVIRTSGQHLLTVINDILDISRIDQDVKFLLEKRPLSLRKCLKDAVSLAGLTPLHDVSRQISVIEWPPEMDDLGPFTELEETNILPLLWSIDHDVPEHLLGDITRLRQVLINLCTNSLKFTQHGRVSVHVSVHKPQQNGVAGSMPTSPMLTGTEPRQQMIFEQRYDVKSEALQSLRVTSSRRRPWDSVVASKSRGSNNHLNSSASSSSSSPAQHPPSMKVVAPTANTLDNDTLDENTVILEFAVSDTGVGIPANKITELFTSFTQVDISVSTRFGGTGLGLAISASLVEKMGGHIWVESTEGVGLNDALERIGANSVEHESAPASGGSNSPRLKSPRSEVEELQAAGNGSSAASASVPLSQNTRTYAKVVESSIKPVSINGTPLRILLAEDNPVNQKVALGVLRKLGYSNVDVAQNGLEVISNLDLGHVYDLILMDVSMPLMDGIEATKKIVERRLRGLIYAHTESQPASSSVLSTDNLQPQDLNSDQAPAAASSGEETISKSHPSPLTTSEEEPRESVLLRDYKDLYVIALTASAMGTDKERCMEAGMDDFMTKPFAAPEMKRVLSAFVERRVRGDLETRNDRQLQRALEKKSRCHSPGCLQKKSSDSSINSEKLGLPTLYRSKSPSLLDSTPCQGCDGSGSSKDSEEENGGSSQRPSRLDTPRPLRKMDSTLSSFLNSGRSGSDAGLHGLFSSKTASPTTPCMLSSLDERLLDRRWSQEQQRSLATGSSIAGDRSASHSPAPQEGQQLDGETPDR